MTTSLAARWFGSILVTALLGSLALRAHAEPAAQKPPPPAPVQPLPYSHRQHLALPGVECRRCHLNPGEGKLMTYPATSICMTCHASIPAGDKPALQKLADFAVTTKPIPWVRVYEVPDFVYWSHKPHLRPDLACVTCHGPVPERDVIARETTATTMNACISCHDDRQVSSDCGFCHEPRQ